MTARQRKHIERTTRELLACRSDLPAATREHRAPPAQRERSTTRVLVFGALWAIAAAALVWAVACGVIRA